MASRSSVQNVDEISQAPTNFENNLSPSESIPLVDQPQQSQLSRSIRENVFRHCFEIEKKTFMVIPYDDDEPRSIYDVL